MSKNCQLQHLTLLCAAMEDSFNLLDYEWSDLEDDVSPSRRVRYSPVKNGESSGIELSSSLEIDMDSLVYQPLMSSSPAAVTSTTDTVTPAAVSSTSETVTSARPASPIIWTTPIPTTTTTVPVPAPTGNTTAVPLWRESLQAMNTGGAELKTSPRSAAAALAPPPVTEPSAPLPAPVMSPGPASAAAVQGEVICSALGCMVMGTTEALGTHWLDLHEVEKMLWLCPMPRCHMKSRSRGMLDIHLRVQHKASRPVAGRLREEIPPLVDWVVNRKYQFPGVARPQFVILPTLPHGALVFNMKETVITEVAAIFPKGSTQGPSSMPRAPAAETLVSTQDAKQPRQVTTVGSWYELAVRPPPPPPLASMPLPPSPPPAVLPPPALPTPTPVATPSGLLPPPPQESSSLPPPPPQESSSLPPPPPQESSSLPLPPPQESSSLPPPMPLSIPLPSPAPASLQPETWRVVLTKTRSVPDSRPAAPLQPADDPTSSNYLRGHVRSLDGPIEDLLWQRREATEAAFSAMKKEYERKALECKVLKRRVAVLEGKMRGYEASGRYIPRPTIVGHLQSVGSTRIHLLVPDQGHTAVYPLRRQDLAVLGLEGRDQAISCDPL